MTRRLVINPDPLRSVDARPGGPTPELKFLVCRLSRDDVLLRASVHKEYCPRAPQDGKQLKNKTVWHTKLCSRAEMSAWVAEMEDAAIEVAVWCSKCRGWSVV